MGACHRPQMTPVTTRVGTMERRVASFGMR